MDNLLLGTWQLPSAPVTLGRDASCGLRADHEWVSREQARLHPLGMGWLLHNGPRTRVLVQNEWVDAWFRPGAQVYLQRGDCLLTWDLDLRLTLRIRPGVSAALPIATDPVPMVEPKPGEPLPSTAAVADGLDLTALQRARLGALFAYLIEGAPKPDNIAAAAAVLLSTTPRAVLRTALDVRERLNRQRWEPIEHLEDLGHYLVEVAGVIGRGDLPTAAPGGTWVPLPPRHRD